MMKPVTVYLSASMVNLLHANAQLSAHPDEDLDCAAVLARVVSLKAKGFGDEVIYLATPIEWRECIDTEPS